LKNKVFASNVFWTIFLTLQVNFVLLMILVVWRRIVSTTLLFDQFVFLTFLCIPLGLTFFLAPPLKQRLQFGKLERFLVSLVISLLFFSTAQYSILAVDRSRSLYIFSWIETKKVVSDGSKILLAQKESAIEDFSSPRALQQRIDEQISRKLMKVSKEGLVENTFIGKLFLLTAENLAAVFKLTGWYRNTI